MDNTVFHSASEVLFIFCVLIDLIENKSKRRKCIYWSNNRCTVFSFSFCSFSVWTKHGWLWLKKKVVIVSVVIFASFYCQFLVFVVVFVCFSLSCYGHFFVLCLLTYSSTIFKQEIWTITLYKSMGPGLSCPLSPWETWKIPGPRNQSNWKEFSYLFAYLHLCVSCCDMSKYLQWQRAFDMYQCTCWG